MLSERLLTSAVGSGSISDKLVNISNSLTLMRISNLVALVNSLGIVVLAVLFYVVFHEQYKIISLVALGCFLAEAITLAVSKIGAYALIPLSERFVEAGAPEPSYFQTLGDFLYHGVDRLGYDIHMLFFCLGGILWYYLFYVSRYIPPALSIWGLVAVCLLTLPVLAGLYNRDFTSVMMMGLPYVPFELVLGVWLIVKGFN
jgi:multidrug transporter EmrE-like cation transporter